MKGDVIGFTPLNKLSYHFINLGLTFICRFLQSLCLSSWCFSSHRHSFIFSKAFIFWMNHWVLCSLFSNVIPWYWFAGAIHHIDILRVNQNRIHCNVISVSKTAQGWQVIISTCNSIYKGWDIFVFMPTMDYQSIGF